MSKFRNRTIQCLACLAAIGFAGVTTKPAWGQLSFTGGATVDFTGFNGAGFTPSPAAGQLDSDTWAATGFDNSAPFGSTATSGDAARGPSAGGENTGGVYAFDVGGGNRTLGVQPTGSDFTPGAFTLRVQNDTGAPLTSLAVSYVAYYRNDQPRGNSFNFSWSPNNSAYTNVTDLDLVSPDAATGGTWVANPRSTVISGFNIAAGDSIYLRWSGNDVSGSSNRDEFALDDIILGGGGEPMGACHTNDFQDCEVTTSEECTNLGGVYDGDGTVCPPPVGACCEGMICSGGISEGDCLGVGGVFRGEGTTCGDPGICDPGAGACCVSGVCQITSTPVDCCNLGGVYLGEETTCTPGICNQVRTIQETKSLTDGTAITVEDVIVVSTTDLVSSATSKSFTVQDMSGPAGADRGITVFGPNADIDAILAVATPGTIISISGQLDIFNNLNELSFITGWQVCGDTTAVPAPVNISAADMQTGSATAEALESVVVTLSCVEFNNAGATFAGGVNYTVTDPNTSMTAIVRVSTPGLDLVGQTIPSGGVAITGVMGQFAADYQLQVRSMSDIVPCGTAVGACFINGGADCIVTTQSDCNNQSGVYQGDGTSCPAATGACCEQGGTICTDNISEFDCESVNGSYRGDGSSCSTLDICAVGTGACCLAGDACQIANNPADCCTLGGVFVGEGTTCTPGICDTLLTLDEAKAAADGDPITVANVVVVETTDLISSASSKSIIVQDMSGPAGAPRGITVFGPNADIDAILALAAPGSLLSISGERDEFNGLAELSFITGFQVCGTAAVPAPVAISTVDMQDGSATAEGLESVRVTLSCVTFNDAGGVFAGGTNYTVADANTSQTAVVRVSTTGLDLVGQTIPSGSVAITGILSQFDNSDPRDGGYQLLMVNYADIVPCDVQEACTTTCGDTNGDNTVDGDDIQSFTACVIDSAGGAPATGCACADTNNDNLVGMNDIANFVDAALLGIACP